MINNIYKNNYDELLLQTDQSQPQKHKINLFFLNDNNFIEMKLPVKIKQYNVRIGWLPIKNNKKTKWYRPINADDTDTSLHVEILSINDSKQYYILVKKNQCFFC